MADNKNSLLEVEKLDTLDDVRKAMANVWNNVKLGNMKHTTGNSLGYLAQVIIDILKYQGENSGQAIESYISLQKMVRVARNRTAEEEEEEEELKKRGNE